MPANVEMHTPIPIARGVFNHDFRSGQSSTRPGIDVIPRYELKQGLYSVEDSPAARSLYRNPFGPDIETVALVGVLYSILPELENNHIGRVFGISPWYDGNLEVDKIGQNFREKNGRFVKIARRAIDRYPGSVTDRETACFGNDAYGPRNDWIFHVTTF